MKPADENSGTRYVELPNGSYLEWPEGVSAADFKAKAQRLLGPRPGTAHPELSGKGPVDVENAFQRTIDQASQPDSSDTRATRSTIENALSAFGHGTVRTLLGPIAHPIDTAKGLMEQVAHSSPYDIQNPLAQQLEGEISKFHREPLSQSIPDTAGEVAGMVIGTKLPGVFGEIGDSALGKIGDRAQMLSEAAKDNPDVAALRGLRITPKSSKVQSMLKNVQIARPYLQGADSLEDLQSRVHAAKAEIWEPYQKTIDTMGKTHVKGPSGITTLENLERERLQLSALNRGLKMRDPEAIQLAQQKGLTQAKLLKQEKAVTSFLDPELSRYGINPKEIRRTFGAVSRIGQQVSGKSTLLEPLQRSGLGRMLNMKIENPRTWIGEPAKGLRDLVAGRPVWSSNPTDIGIKEGFRGAYTKPNLGSFQPPRIRGLLNAPEVHPEFEYIPTGEIPIDMIETPGQLVQASRFPNKNITGGSPDPFNLRELGNRATLPPAYMTRKAYMTGTDEPINDLKRSGPGVLIRPKIQK